MSPRRRTHDTHLPPCVYRRHGAYWLVRRGRWQRLGADLKSSLAAYAAIMETPKGGMAELIEEALEQILAAVKPSTRKGYRHAANTLKRIFAEFAPEQVQPRDVAGMKRSLKDKPNYANRCLSLLRQIFDYALEDQLIERNPAVGVKRYAERKRSRLITLEEYRAIREKASPRLQIVMDLCVLTGQRISDVLAIRRADLTDEGIRFKPSKTGEKRGTVAWTPELRAVVEQAKALQGQFPVLTLLVNRRRKRPDYSTVKWEWDRACTAANVKDAHLHDLRALAATWAKKEGKDATALLMHSSAAQTERYLRDKEARIIEGPSFVGQSIRQADKKQ